MLSYLLGAVLKLRNAFKVFLTSYSIYVINRITPSLYCILLILFLEISDLSNCFHNY